MIFLLIGIAVVARSDDDNNGNNSKQWPLMGQGLNNWRSQPAEDKISTANVATLSPRWTFDAGADVSATPTVDDQNVYFPDWSGKLYAVKKSNGKAIWTHAIADYDHYTGSISRVSPAIHNDDLIFGDVESGNMAHSGASMMAVNKKTGTLRWITRVDTHPAAIITGSAVVFNDVVYVGISSNEEGLATDPAYPCCSFRGSMVALNANTGEILWKTYMLPDNHGQTDGYSGNAIWQPPAIDAARGTLYIGTGNNYDVPKPVEACLAASADAQKPQCFAADDYFDAGVSLDLKTGQVKWARRLQGFDVWTVACIRNPNPVSCPVPSSPDYDMGGSGPNLLPSIVGFGQKSGIYWALNPDNGDMVWSSVVGPGGTLGGIEWGTATDGKRIYAAITNNAHKSYPLINGQTITWGAWSALDVATGKILWQTADPAHALAMGSVSVANGVVYAPSYSGNMHALDASSGNLLWTFASGGSVLDGPSIADGVVYWGSGYKKISPGTANNKVFAFRTKGDNRGDDNSNDQ